MPTTDQEETCPSTIKKARLIRRAFLFSHRCLLCLADRQDESPDKLFVLKVSL